jgi:lipoprotein-anchoring transpeptidase ErfK/SrfK
MRPKSSFPCSTFLFALAAAVLSLAGCASQPAPAPAWYSSSPPGSYDAQPRSASEIPSYGGPKRVVINKNDQILRAYDGGHLVFACRVSTGREGKRTPDGQFTAEMKQRMHHSYLYNDAPMPYSVQFSGDYFIHGYTVVPFQPASHGCIRLPLNSQGRNPAQIFYNWVDVGTPIEVTGQWQA